MTDNWDSFFILLYRKPFECHFEECCFFLLKILILKFRFSFFFFFWFLASLLKVSFFFSFPFFSLLPTDVLWWRLSFFFLPNYHYFFFTTNSFLNKFILCVYPFWIMIYSMFCLQFSVYLLHITRCSYTDFVVHWETYYLLLSPPLRCTSTVIRTSILQKKSIIVS